MKAREQGFNMRQILWQNASCLQSNGLLSATLKTGKFTGKMVVLVVADGPPLLTDAMLVDQDASISSIPFTSAHDIMFLQTPYFGGPADVEAPVHFGKPRPPRPKKKPPVRDKTSHHHRSDAAGQGTRPSAQSKH